MKAREREQARSLRRATGMPIKQIAREVGVSASTASRWTADIDVSAQVRAANLRAAGERRGAAWAARSRRLREAAQQHGRIRARAGEPLHQAGCMLYWAEGEKSRNRLCLTNADVHLVAFFRRFLVESLLAAPDRLRLRLHLYTGAGLTVREVELYWLSVLELPASCLRGHVIDRPPSSSSGSRVGRLPHGVASLRVAASTDLVQHVYGAIQEYAGFSEPGWLDGPGRT